MRRITYQWGNINEESKRVVYITVPEIKSYLLQSTGGIEYYVSH